MYKELIISVTETNEKEISSVEKQLGISFPDAFKNFYIEFNGALLNHAEIEAEHSSIGQTSYSVQNFIPTDKIGTINVENWNDDHVAFAEDSFGNYFRVMPS